MELKKNRYLRTQCVCVVCVNVCVCGVCVCVRVHSVCGVCA